MVQKLGATFLVDRKEIAQAMNFGKYPVLSMEIGVPARGWKVGEVYKGCKCRVRSTRTPDIYFVCELSMYEDEQSEEVKNRYECWEHIHLSEGGTFLQSDFGYSDVKEMLENANTPWVEPGQEVIVVFDGYGIPDGASINERCCYVRKMKASNKVCDFYSTVLTLENI